MRLILQLSIMARHSLNKQLYQFCSRKRSINVFICKKKQTRKVLSDDTKNKEKKTHCASIGINRQNVIVYALHDLEKF